MCVTDISLMGVTNVCALFTPRLFPPARGIVGCAVIFVLSALVFVGLPQGVPRFVLVFIMWQAIGHMSLVLLRYYRRAIVVSMIKREESTAVGKTQLHTRVDVKSNKIAVLPIDEEDDFDNNTPGGEEKCDPVPKAPKGGRSNQSVALASSGIFTAERELDANKTVAEIVNKQLAQMMIIPFTLFRAFGAIPRSNSTKSNSGDAGDIAKMGSAASISQPHEAGWIVVFISHRWWGGNHPDDKERKLKHGIICRGVKALIRRDKLDASRVSVWIDYACIEQDNDEEMQNGIDSLIAYVHCARTRCVCVRSVCVCVCVCVSERQRERQRQRYIER